MDNKKFGNVAIVIWAMIFCVNLILCLLNPNPWPIHWICTGFALGMLVALLMIKPVMNAQDSLIKTLFKSNKRLIEFSNEVTKELTELTEKIKKKTQKKRK